MSQRRIAGPAPARPHEGTLCQACRDVISPADSYLSVYPSWERHHHYLHARCWHELMKLAQDTLLRQADIFTGAEADALLNLPFKR